MKIRELISDISNRNLVLPEFQREYVWSNDQAKKLMASLIKEYPVGSLLIWKTNSPPDLKKIEYIPEILGTVKVILDGQQRLTALYMLITGEIPPYYSREEIENDPRNLYFNLEDGELQYYQIKRMKDNPLWCKVTDCFKPENEIINIFKIAGEKASNETERFELAQKYNNNINRLRRILDIELTEETIPPHASLDDAIDIFDLVNSQGTKLTEAELALTHVSGKWPRARKEMKAKIDELNERNFYFDLSFMTRALTCVVTRRALFETIHDRPREDLETGWKQLIKILDYIVSILPKHAFIHSTVDLNTNNVLIPWIVYLSQNGGHFPNESSLKSAIHWLFSAQIWARYTAQTDQRLEQDVSLVFRDESPWNSLREQIIDQRGRIEVKTADLEGRGAQHPLYKMLYILVKARGAIDWFNGAPLGTSFGKAYQIHSHHIFPQSILYKNNFDPNNHLDRKVVNEIANRSFLTADTNFDISNKDPQDYLVEVHGRYPEALESQLIPLNPYLWKLENFEEFLEARRQTIARELNEFMNRLISEPEKNKKLSLGELISLGEGLTLEFKSTLQWDVVQNQVNKGLRQSVLKTIAAFLNTEGGTLIIGLDDDGEVFGLNADLREFNQSTDKFLQLLYNLISEYLGPQYASLIKAKNEFLNGAQVCVIEVNKAPEAVFLAGTKGKEFYIRVGNTTRALDTQQALDFIDRNWS